MIKLWRKLPQRYRLLLGFTIFLPITLVLLGVLFICVTLESLIEVWFDLGKDIWAVLKGEKDE